MKVSFHQRVRQGYHQLVQQEPERWRILNADRHLADIQAELRQIIKERLKSK